MAADEYDIGTTAGDNMVTKTKPATKLGAPDDGPRVEHTAANERPQSVDIPRGFDMFWISGGDSSRNSLSTDETRQAMKSAAACAGLQRHGRRRRGQANHYLENLP
jgi:hypothetical protein